MTFMHETLKSPQESVRAIPLPVRAIYRVDGAGTDITYHPSPVDWAGEVLYFLLPDRFSDELD